MSRLEAIGASLLDRTIIGKHVEHPGRLLHPSLIIGDIVPQLAENFPLSLQTAETSVAVDPLLDYLVPPDLRGHFLDTTASWIPGERKGAILP